MRWGRQVALGKPQLAVLLFAWILPIEKIQPPLPCGKIEQVYNLHMSEILTLVQICDLIDYCCKLKIEGKENFDTNGDPSAIRCSGRDSLRLDVPTAS